MSSLVETEIYVLITCKLTDHNLLIRKSDNAISYVSDTHLNLLVENAENETIFDTMASTFVFMDLVMEKQSC